jgi:hypothetical protein
VVPRLYGRQAKLVAFRQNCNGTSVKMLWTTNARVQVSIRMIKRLLICFCKSNAAFPCTQIILVIWSSRTGN